MTQRCSQFGKEATEVWSQTIKPKLNETARILLVPPSLCRGWPVLQTQDPWSLFAAVLTSKCQPIFALCPFWQRSNTEWCSDLDSWRHRFSLQFSFFFVPIWHVLINGFSEQNLVTHPIHPYSPAPCCLPTRTSAPAMQPMPRMQTTIPMKCTALYRTSKKNQESSITTGMTKQSRSCQEKEEKLTN